MPRVRKAASGKEKGETPPKIAQYLDDGHPNPGAMSVWEFMQELSEEQWTEYVGYLYRVQPRKQPTDRAAYIAVISSPVTLEDIKRLYGGQKFTIHFNRRIGKKQKGIYTVQFDIEAEAIPQDGEVFEKPLTPGRASAPAAVGTDATVLQGLTELISNLVAQNTASQAEGRTFDPSAAIAEAIKIQGDGARAAIKLIGDQARGESRAGGFQDDILKRLLDRAFDQTSSPPPDPLAQIKAVLDLTKEIRPEGGEGGAQNNPWAALATAVGPKLDTILERLAGIVQNWAFISASKNPAALAQLQKANQPAATPAAPAAPAAPGTQAEEAPAEAAASPTKEQIAEFERVVVVKRVKSAIIQMLFAGEPGGAAAEVAEKMAPEWVDDFAKTLQNNIASLADDPILAPAVTAPRLADFTAEFLDYFEQEEPPAEAPAETQAEALSGA